MPLSDLLRLADIALSGHAGPDLPEEILRVVVEETGSRAGVLKRGGEAIARWPRTVSAQVEEATEGWSEIPFGGDEGHWCLRLLQLDRLDEAALDTTRISLRAPDGGSASADALRGSLADADGNGITEFRVYEYGPGDKIEITSYAHLERQENGGWAGEVSPGVRVR